MNFLSLDVLDFGEPDKSYTRVLPCTFSENFSLMIKPLDNIEFTSLGKFYLMKFMDLPEARNPNKIATFLCQSTLDNKRVLYGDYLIFSNETFQKITTPAKGGKPGSLIAYYF